MNSLDPQGHGERCCPEREVSPRDDTPARVRATCRAIEAAAAPPRIMTSRAG